MKRYINSFLITLVLYSGVIFALFTLFADEKILLKKEKPLHQTISLKHIELLPMPKIEKKIVKKEVVKKIEPKKKIIKKAEKKKVKKIVKKKVVKKKIVKKPKKVVKKKPIKKKEIKEKKVKKEKQIIKEVQKQVQKEAMKEIVKEKITNIQNTKKVASIDIEQEILSKFQKNLIRKEIEKNVRYPKSAKRLKIQGIVYVKFTLRSNGKVDNIVIINGHSRLKKSTINAVKDAASSFPKIKKDITIQLPIEYKLI